MSIASLFFATFYLILSCCLQGVHTRPSSKFGGKILKGPVEDVKTYEDIAKGKGSFVADDGLPNRERSCRVADFEVQSDFQLDLVSIRILIIVVCKLCSHSVI